MIYENKYLVVVGVVLIVVVIQQQEHRVHANEQRRWIRDPSPLRLCWKWKKKWVIPYG